MSSDWGVPAVKAVRDELMRESRADGLSSAGLASAGLVLAELSPAGLAEHSSSRRVVPKSSPAEFMASVTPSV